LAAVACAASCSDGSRREERAERVSAALEIALAPDSEPAQRDGLAAAILIDVSRSMAEEAGSPAETKIVGARRAALDLVEQFARYADDHPDEPVLLGIYEFSQRSGQPDVREVIPMGPPRRDSAAAAVARMNPNGGTPIGEAMITGKRALDAAGLSNRHLLVITDGENTDGYTPEQVAAAIDRRPYTERPSLYFIAFDISASKFDGMRSAGALVLEATDGRTLNERLDTLLKAEILLERE
jgi:Mg-chelatase subunit ChlD